ncbi:M15 family metallopeptidase [Rhodocytophaga rosea]|uniref:D-alanyl-D-alanine dipeptidase n=1 Tax=Rhodocytophaga rosea TaxID=2704465 RepID=A0A6C0GKW3_9BACT|nr:M15 family metallopeptidase [Rhodocytophaga rosea]QHT68721.1 M15 family metallopeptidase [Rhodocytophaga rosea]
MLKTKLLHFFIAGILFLTYGCQSSTEQTKDPIQIQDTLSQAKTSHKIDTVSTRSEPRISLLTNQELNNLPDSSFVELLTVDSTFVLDMKYATPDNFLKSKVYDCDKCLLRVKVAKALAKAQKAFADQGYRIKLFDCYRPLDVQKRMWALMPDKRYVGNPYQNGSVHNKGAAVDLTLVDAEGKEVDMGTSFDHFGREAHHAYTNLPQETLQNRKLLKQGMESAGFLPITSEWWHYFYQNNRFPVANFKPACP